MNSHHSDFPENINSYSIMSNYIDSHVSTPKMSTSSSESIHDVNTVPESSHSTTIFRLKDHWHKIRKEWGPLMAAKEHLYDEYTFPPGRYAGQGLQK